MLRFVQAAALAVSLSFAAPAANSLSGELTPAQPGSGYTTEELLETGHAFFGNTSAGLASVLQQAFSVFGQPNGYILGEEGAGALFGGLRYGEGVLQIAGQNPEPVFWQGPSFGWDFGGSGSRVMMLVYNVPSSATLMQRFTGVDGSAYIVGGVSMTMMAAHESYLVPVRTGVGARLGVSLGYLKFTPEPTWNPF
ncbi:MAG: EipA family protein [Pseudomonadota bacterium]